MKNRNIVTQSGTLTGQPVTIQSSLVCREWQFQNTGPNRLTVSFGPGSDVAIPPGQGFRVELERKEVTLSGTTSYSMEAAELVGSLDMA